VLLSHNGMDVDLKLASRVTGIDAILGGHTHDAVPQPVTVKNAKGVTLVTNAGSNGKFLGVLDVDIGQNGVRGYEYRLLPVFSNMLPADPAMSKLITEVRAPYASKLSEPLAVTEGLLYRRGNFNGTLDEVILDAQMATFDCDIAFSPGFRWGTTILPNTTITVEDVMNVTAITYPSVTVNELTGEAIKALLEDLGDNVFNPDPYHQQGGDMVRTGGLQYTCRVNAPMGKRLDNILVRGKPLDASRRYKVASWAPVAEGASGKPIWDVVIPYLRARKTIQAPKLYRPAIVGA
jgi:sulfur-oxidizing protein SoxB